MSDFLSPYMRRFGTLSAHRDTSPENIRGSNKRAINMKVRQYGEARNVRSLMAAGAMAERERFEANYSAAQINCMNKKAPIMPLFLD